MSCKLDNVPPISPKELKLSKFDQVISSHKPVIGLSNKESFDNNVQPIGVKLKERTKIVAGLAEYFS